jgi:hypothetical protein
MGKEIARGRAKKSLAPGTYKTNKTLDLCAIKFLPKNIVHEKQLGAKTHLPCFGFVLALFFRCFC